MSLETSSSESTSTARNTEKWKVFATFFSIFLASGDFVTDVLFCIQVKREGTPKNAFFSASLAFVIIPMIFNLYRIFDLCSYSEVVQRFKVSEILSNFKVPFFYNGFVTSSYMAYHSLTAETPDYNFVQQLWWDKIGPPWVWILWPLYVLNWILQVIVWIFMVIVYVLLFILAIAEQFVYIVIVTTNAELLYDKFGVKDMRMKIVMVGLLLEDLPQLIIQGIYTRYAVGRIPPVVVLSIVVSAWHIGYSFFFNWSKREEDPLNLAWNLMDLQSIYSSVPLPK